MRYAHLAARIFATPLAVEPNKADIIMAAIGDRFDLDVQSLSAEQIQAMEAREFRGPKTDNGIAIIPITGTLVNRAHGMDALSGMISYASLTDQILDAAVDENITGILLDIDSPGGEVAGMFDLVDTIKEARTMKPVFASANDHAFSAAYAIASAADRIFVTRTGGVGSIGAIAIHVDESEANEKAGLKYTVVRSGEYKAEHSPLEPLTEHARGSLEERVNRFGGMFAEIVAENRGLSLAAVQDTKAGVYFGSDGVQAKLADEIGTAKQALAALEKFISTPQQRGMAALHHAENIMEDKENSAATDDKLVNIEAKLAQAKADGRAELAAQITEISQLCAIAVCPAKAAEFIQANATVADVRSALINARADAPENDVDNGHDAAESRPEAHAAVPINAAFVEDVYTRLNNANKTATV